jgi:hypothetical protein
MKKNTGQRSYVNTDLKKNQSESSNSFLHIFVNNLTHQHQKSANYFPLLVINKVTIFIKARRIKRSRIIIWVFPIVFKNFYTSFCLYIKARTTSYILLDIPFPRNAISSTLENIPNHTTINHDYSQGQSYQSKISC